MPLSAEEQPRVGGGLEVLACLGYPRNSKEAAVASAERVRQTVERDAGKGARRGANHCEQGKTD